MVILIFVVVLFILNSRSEMAPVITPSTNSGQANTPGLSKLPQATPISTLTLVPTPTLSTALTPTSVAKEEVFEILISENGLSKNNLAIKAGDTVKFTNNDSATHWPASGPHPTHTLCPGFDSLRELKQGETYSFTFNKAGVCQFHDHINANAQYRGTITVME